MPNTPLGQRRTTTLQIRLTSLLWLPEIHRHRPKPNLKSTTNQIISFRHNSLTVLLQRKNSHHQRQEPLVGPVLRSDLVEAKTMSDRNSTDEFRPKLGHSHLPITLLRDTDKKRTTAWQGIGRQEILQPYLLPFGVQN
jgi:hypothetical protein